MTIQTSFVCQQCGSEFAKWLGKCSVCDSWNSLVESVKVTGKLKSKASQSNRINSKTSSSIQKLSDIKPSATQRILKKCRITVTGTASRRGQTARLWCGPRRTATGLTRRFSVSRGTTRRLRRWMERRPDLAARLAATARAENMPDAPWAGMI